MRLFDTLFGVGLLFRTYKTKPISTAACAWWSVFLLQRVRGGPYFYYSVCVVVRISTTACAWWSVFETF